MALVTGTTLPWYDRPFETKPWPGPAPLPAEIATGGPSVNDTCPFTGGPTRYFLKMNGAVYGFENQLCRDETVQDPEAWPAFMELANR